jgi:quercetin dioxygenase-like cupin family protein
LTFFLRALCSLEEPVGSNLKNARLMVPKDFANLVAQADNVVVNHLPGGAAARGGGGLCLRREAAMKGKGSNGRRPWAVGVGLVALTVLVGAGAWGYYHGAKITVNTLDEVLKGNPLPADKTAQVTWKSRAGNSELQVIEMSKIKLHHHDQEDHIVYVARGQGTARLGDETRHVKAGDILNLPKGIPHSFTKEEKENLVLLVVATAGWKPLEDTKFYE